jgi:hypothetical protein
MKWLEALLAQKIGLTLLIWTALYLADYFQTLRGARLYHAVGKQYTVLEGSYELTPFFQPDIDNLRTISLRLLMMLLASLIILIILGWLASVIGVPEIFSLGAGGLILRSLVVHIRHIRNIASFKYVARHPDQIHGRLEYSRPLLLWNSAVDLGAFGGLFLIVFALTGSWFVAGGSLGCLAIAARMLLWRRKAAPAPVKTTKVAEPNDAL